jgi:enamine deaminase RidA (YjgF/YER057c/UK114 family)
MDKLSDYVVKTVPLGDARPTVATLVGVQSLASEDWLVEIEVTAVIR